MTRTPLAEGAGNYGTTEGLCDRSDDAWPNLVDANNPDTVLKANLACSGAVAIDLLIQGVEANAMAVPHLRTR